MSSGTNLPKKSESRILSLTKDEERVSMCCDHGNSDGPPTGVKVFRFGEHEISKTHAHSMDGQSTELGFRPKLQRISESIV